MFMVLALLRALFALKCCSRWRRRCSLALYGKRVRLTGLICDRLGLFFFSFSDGDTVEIGLAADGKTLHIRDNHAVDESTDSSATHQEPTQ
jgi:hypothetical protein